MKRPDIFCDLAKGSDCVIHDVRQEKLFYYGMHGTASHSLRSY
jgi:hypothetical protein